MTGELMTSAMAEKIAEYDAMATRWRYEQTSLTKGAWFCLALCTLLWMVSFYAAGFEGPVGRTSWLATFSLCTFVGGLAMGITFTVCCIRKIIVQRPVRPVITKVVD